ncbi:MAG: Uma2 family endonuclease [Planctomycetaceae bacterium]
MAIAADVFRFQREEHRFCELSDGILVEKDLGSEESVIAGRLLTFLNHFVIPRRLGLVMGEAGMLKINPHTVRIPDAAFVSVQRLPWGAMPSEALPRRVPNLVVEVLSRANNAEEMQHKLRDDFEASVDLVWMVEPRQRTVEVFTASDSRTSLKETQFLTGGSVLPGFRLKVRQPSPSDFGHLGAVLILV